MERLQAAIEKARAQRETRDNPELPSERSAPARRPVPIDLSSEIEARWLTLPEIKLRARRLHRNRVVTIQSGPIAGPYDILRTRLLQQAQAKNWRRIAIVSPHSGCGKSTTVANIAFGLARQSGVRSIVFDFDLRRSGLGHLLGQKRRVPMSDVLEMKRPFSDIAKRYQKNLIFGLGSGGSRRASEVLQAPDTRQVLEEVEETYAPDLVIFDMPPLAASDDNFGFLNRVDAALIVAEAESTSLTQIDVAERQVAELTNVLGIVLNKCRYTSGAYGYESKYY